MHGRQSGNGNARRAWTPHARHPARIIRAVRAEIGLQQREFHQVELCAATADAFEFAGNRFERVDRGGEISPFESGEGVRHRRYAGPGWITTVARELVHLPCARLQRRVIAGHDLGERDVHVGKGYAGARKRAVREVVHHAPCFGVARVPGEFPAPQKGNRIVQLAARRSAVHVGREGVPKQSGRRRCIAGLEVAEREVPAQMAVERAVARIGGQPRRQKGAGCVRIALLVAEVRAGVRRPRVVGVLGEGSIDLWAGVISCPFSESAMP